MNFKYKAMNPKGRLVSGQLQAENDEDLEQRLQNMQLELINYRQQNPRAHRSPKIPREELITFYFYMEQLLRAGVPLLDCLHDMRNTLEQSPLRDVLSSLIEDVQAGLQLSEAMQRFPKTFNSVSVQLIAVGEISGELDKIFTHLTEMVKWEDELISQTKRLLMYPSFTLVVIGGLLAFVLTYLVPELTGFLASVLPGELPMRIQILNQISDFVINYWYLFLIIPFLLITLLISAIKMSYQLRLKVDGWKLHLWLIGPILQKIILARFAAFFSLMYAAGITVIDCLETTRKITGNLAIEAALSEVQKNIDEGMKMSDSFAKARLFPPLVVRMVSIGENTGELDIALNNVSYFYDRQVKESIGKIQAVIEPVLILIMGLILGGVIFSVLGPLYDVISVSSKGLS